MIHTLFYKSKDSVTQHYPSSLEVLYYLKFNGKVDRISILAINQILYSMNKDIGIVNLQPTPPTIRTSLELQCAIARSAEKNMDVTFFTL